MFPDVFRNRYRLARTTVLFSTIETKLLIDTRALVTLAELSRLACNRLHDTDQRFARCLLEVRDRVQSNEFPLTHGFMAEMLGIRRASVTDAATKLKKLEVIETKRGKIRIKHSQDLEKISCECHLALTI